MTSSCYYESCDVITCHFVWVKELNCLIYPLHQNSIFHRIYTWKNAYLFKTWWDTLLLIQSHNQLCIVVFIMHCNSANIMKCADAKQHHPTTTPPIDALFIGGSSRTLANTLIYFEHFSHRQFKCLFNRFCTI